MDNPDIHRQSDANIRRFQEYLSSHPEISGNIDSRIYELFLDPMTGEFKFPVNIGHLESRLPFHGRGGLQREWVLIHLQVSETSSPHRVEFTVLDAQNKELKTKEFNSVCQRVLNETLGVLNQKGTNLLNSPSTLPGEFGYEGEKEPEIQDISRKEAEIILKNQPVGTYLLRRGDDLDHLIEQQLSSSNAERVSLYTVSYVDTDENMSELMVAKTLRGWTIFNDDPRLKQGHYTYFRSLQQLLGAQKITRRLQQ